MNNIKFGINYFNGINENNNDDAYFAWIKEEGFNAVEIGCRYAELVNNIYGEVNTEKVAQLKEQYEKEQEPIKKEALRTKIEERKRVALLFSIFKA